MKRNKYLVLFLSLIIFTSIILLPINSFADTKDVSTNKEIIDSQSEILKISDFLDNASKYSPDFFEEVDFDKILNNLIQGKIDNSFFINIIVKIIGKEAFSSIKVISSIMVIIVIHGILNSFNQDSNSSNVANIAYYVQYILIITIVMTNFSNIIDLVKTSINNLVIFCNSLIPILMTLMITTGSIASSSILYPIMLFLITFIGNFINGIILPATLIATSLSIVSKISDKVQLNNLSKFFKSGVVWALGIVLTIFVGVVSLEGSLSSSVDGLTSKTTKAVVSNFVPIVGKILSDSVETVLGCTNILKNAIGIIGVLVVVGICILPIIKLLLIMATYYIGSAICEPIADKKITSLLSQIGDTYKTLLAIMCSISVILIIGITLVLKISNTGLMYN